MRNYLIELENQANLLENANDDAINTSRDEVILTSH